MRKSDLAGAPAEPAPPPAVPVICDRCRAEGSAGDDPFTAIRDLLNFDPVKRRAHLNNWTAEHQRAFIAALAITGSPRQAARALGRHAFGAEQLKTARGGRSFAEAWDAALELYRERELFRIKDNLAGLAQQQASRHDGGLAQSHLRALPPPGPHSSPAFAGEGNHAQHGGGVFFDDEEPPCETAPSAGAPGDDLTLALFRKIILKIEAERRARLAGKTAEADLYLRQITYVEVAFDLASEDPFARLSELRRDHTHVTDIAETDFSRFFDELRRATWTEMEERERPAPPDHLLVDHGTYRTEPMTFTAQPTRPPQRSHPDEPAPNARIREFHARHRLDGEEQMAWESRAFAEHRR